MLLVGEVKEVNVSDTHTHERRFELPVSWPSPPLSVVLIEPEIPPNTGNIARLCAATGSPLHLVGPLGFRLHDRAVRRAGVDYWDATLVTRHVNFEAFMLASANPRCYFFSTRGNCAHYDVEYQAGDALVFGSESRGISDSLLDKYPDQVVQIPMQLEHVRSLNLANSVAIALYEAIRQLQY